MLPEQRIDKLIRKSSRYTKTFRWLKPTNLRTEKKRFFNSPDYNPHFSYPPSPKDAIEKLIKQLENTNVNPDNFEKYVISRRINEALLKLRLTLAVGRATEITLLTQKLYDLRFNKKTLNAAKKDADLNREFTAQENFTAKETADKIKTYLKRKYNITNWDIRTTTRRDFYLQVRFKKRLLRVSNKLNWDFNTLDSMLAHEIDGHIIRAVNSSRQNDPLLQESLPFYIKTEEGLASFLGDYFSDSGKLSLKHHAVKYLAGYFALTNSFRETYNLFLDYGFTHELAFQRTLRLKKGLTDTSLPGCNAREAMYYEGMYEVKRYLEKGGRVEKLFASKAGLKDIEHVQIPKNIIIPHRVKRVLNDLQTLIQ